jgi:hypothetical protein
VQLVAVRSQTHKPPASGENLAELARYQ